MRRLMRASISVSLLCAAMGLVYGQSTPPAKECAFDGARVDAAVRRIAGSSPAPYYFACQVHNPNANGTGCVKGSLPPGLVVTVDRELAGWSCVTGGDSTSGWVENSRLEELPTQPRPQMADWEGWWHLGKLVQGRKNDRLLITNGERPGSLRVSGRAYWYGLNSVHFGTGKWGSHPDRESSAHLGDDRDRRAWLMRPGPDPHS